MIFGHVTRQCLFRNNTVWYTLSPDTRCHVIKPRIPSPKILRSWFYFNILSMTAMSINNPVQTLISRAVTVRGAIFALKSMYVSATLMLSHFLSPHSDTAKLSATLRNLIKSFFWFLAFKFSFMPNAHTY